jgi:hypothetical protein
LGSVILPGGTLAGPVNWHPRYNPQISLHIAKIGTSLQTLVALIEVMLEELTSH